MADPAKINHSEQNIGFNCTNKCQQNWVSFFLLVTYCSTWAESRNNKNNHPQTFKSRGAKRERRTTILKIPPSFSNPRHNPTALITKCSYYISHRVQHLVQAYSNHTSPNPSVCCIACNSLVFMVSFVWYCGRSNRLKQVWATGR